MDYKALLEHSYAVECEAVDNASESRLEFLSENIFQFTTYDSDMASLFARKALEVCAAITSRTTHEYIKNQRDYEWFLMMCNARFFAECIDWGTSIRGAFWSSSNQFQLGTTGLWSGDEQLQGMWFTDDEWTQFINSMIEFAMPELSPPQ